MMAEVLRLSSRCGAALDDRRTISIDLPEFAIRALQYRADVANESSESDLTVTFNDVIEWYVLSPLSVKEMPHLEAAVPGFTAAFAKWLFQVTYEPPE